MEPPINIEAIRAKLAKRRGVDLPVKGNKRVLLIPRTVIDNKHRDQGFIVIMSEAGFYEFRVCELSKRSALALTFRLVRAGFPLHDGAAMAVAQLLYLVFNVVPPEPMTKPILPALPSVRGTNKTTTRKRKHHG